MEPISPELALVDPQLASFARAALPFPGDCLAPRRRLAGPADVSAHRDLRRPSIVVLVGALVIAALIGTPKLSADTPVPTELATHDFRVVITPTPPALPAGVATARPAPVAP